MTSGNLKFYKDFEKQLLKDIASLQEEEKRFRANFAGISSCLKKDLDTYLKPLTDRISAISAHLKKIQQVIEEGKKTERQRREEALQQLKQKGIQALEKAKQDFENAKSGASGKIGKAGANGRKAESEKCPPKRTLTIKFAR